MNRNCFLLTAMLCACLHSYAQPFERAVRRNLWNDGVNAAGLRCDSLSLSNAELYGSYEAGEFKDVSDPESVLRIGAVARTVSHKEKFSMSGKFGFEQQEWENACGSMLMGDDRYPFDVYEFIPGHKTFQKYDMEGGISIDVAPCWRVGGQLTFESANAAKRKDLRYTAYHLDLMVAPSVQYHNGNVALGASLVYGRNTQNISAEQIGSASSVPSVFFDEGVMTGAYQEWTGGNVHLDEDGVSGFPISVNSLGAALQGQYDNLYADVAFSTYGGFAGEKQVVWYRYRGKEVEARLGWHRGRHSARASFGYDVMKNRRTILDKQTVGGITTTVEYGTNPLLTRNTLSGSIEYEYIASSWEARARLAGRSRAELCSPMFPYTYFRGSWSAAASAVAYYHWRNFDFGVNAAYLMCEAADEAGTLDDAVAVSAKPVTLKGRKALWYKDAMDYLNSPRISAGGSVRWNFCRGLYAEGLGGIVNSRWTAALKFGYNF